MNQEQHDSLISSANALLGIGCGIIVLVLACGVIAMIFGSLGQ